MTEQDFHELRERTTKERWGMGDKKGDSYTMHSDDRLANFKECAKATKQKPEQVWLTYYYKHYCALVDFIATGKEGPEGVNSNISDMLNYLDLLRGLIIDSQKDNSVSIIT